MGVAEPHLGHRLTAQEVIHQGGHGVGGDRLAGDLGIQTGCRRQISPQLHERDRVAAYKQALLQCFDHRLRWRLSNDLLVHRRHVGGRLGGPAQLSVYRTLFERTCHELGGKRAQFRNRRSAIED